MADTEKKNVKNNDAKKSRMDDIQKELSDRGRDVWLAGLGALATVEEEGSKLYQRLIERGKTYERTSTEQIKQLSDRMSEEKEKAVDRAEETAFEAQSALSETMDKALERFGVPTQKEVSDLSEKVDTLSAQIEKLSESLNAENG